MTLDGVHFKIRSIRDNLDRTLEIPHGRYVEFAADFRNLDSALHRRQTTIQTLVELASFATANKGMTTPRTSRDLLTQLETAGYLPVGSTERFSSIPIRKPMIPSILAIDIGQPASCEASSGLS